MKNIFIVLVALVSFSVSAQQKQITDDFVVLTSNPEQLKPILLAAKELNTSGDFKIVLYGNNVLPIATSETEESRIQAIKQNVSLNVCQMSLDRLKVDPKDLPEEVEVVDNAFLTAFQLQKKGYKLLSL
ncbi:DsrE family protein [Aequorivita xiaoshiensis]|uniref:DsrE family protein n=1 Tax=Aequorivita xiaoshiensis TaxID=2874476 RepID=A0A9X1R113_9FLAO|nr:DsrE family protein [Aequorivita xiaoshiensis]MCG2431538.1 DsrE family protein [Aequorivita xiaoshiensis]